MTARIAVDARMVRDSGIGTYIRGLVPRLVAARPDWQFTLMGRREQLEPLGWSSLLNVELIDARSPIYSIGQQLELPRKARRADLFWSPHYDVPLFAPGRCVVTIHDMFHLADRSSHGLRGVARRAYSRLMYEAVLRRADAVMCDSSFTLSEMERLVGRPRGLVRVIPVGVDREWGLADVDSPLRGRPYLLFVGNVKPHKNLTVLLTAFERLMAEIPHDLVIVGRREGMRTVDRAIANRVARLGARVELTGEVDQAVLRSYMRHATALVFPSLYEGFGLPPLEAMMAGCPCIVSTAAAIPEVCGDAALYFDPTDAEELADRIRELTSRTSLAEALRAKGRARAAEFDWQRSVDETAELFDRVLSA
jgi:glycosyltransferase involved in cell wall biosynthesis